MKDGWERTEAPLSIGLEQVRQLVRPVFGMKRVVSSERIGTGLSNSNYKIYVDGNNEPFVLRIYRQDNNIAEKELAIAKLVKGTVPIADFVHLDTTCGIFPLSWAVLEWKEGILLRDALKTRDNDAISSAATSVGSVLADIHAFTFPESGFFGNTLEISEPMTVDSERFVPFIEECLNERCRSWLGEALTRDVLKFCELHAPALSHPEQPVLVHSDFNGLNLLMTPDTNGLTVSAVLDWEYAFSWNRYADIGNLLRYEEDNSIFEHHFVNAYQDKGNRLSPDWKLRSKLEDLIALCDMLSSSTEGTPIRVNDLRNRIARTVHLSQSP